MNRGSLQCLKQSFGENRYHIQLQQGKLYPTNQLNVVPIARILVAASFIARTEPSRTAIRGFLTVGLMLPRFQSSRISTDFASNETTSSESTASDGTGLADFDLADRIGRPWCGTARGFSLVGAGKDSLLLGTCPPVR